MTPTLPRVCLCGALFSVAGAVAIGVHFHVFPATPVLLLAPVVSWLAGSAMLILMLRA